MSESIDLSEPERFIPSDLRPLNVTFESRKSRRKNNKAVGMYKNAHKPTAAGSVENVVTNKSIRVSNDFKRAHGLSMRLDIGKGPPRVSSRSYDGLPEEKKSFPSLKERLGIQRDLELTIDIDEPQ